MRVLCKIVTAGSLVFGVSLAYADDALDDSTSAEGEATIHECLSGEGASCYDYAYFAMNKLNNLATYRLALKRGCELLHFKSCKQLEKDDNEGEAIRIKCESGNVESCMLYSTGRAMMYEDRAGAIKYAIKACVLGDEKSCHKVQSEQAKMVVKKI